MFIYKSTRLGFILLNVVGAEELLEVKVGHLGIARLKEILEFIVHDKHTTVIRVLETLVGDILVDRLGNLATGDELVLLETKERAKLVGNLLLAVETVVLGTLLSLLTVGVVLLRLDLANELSERL
jgi:hypothetical protein